VLADVGQPVAIVLAAQDAGDAGEAALGKLGGDDAVHRSPANAVLHHRRVINVPHHWQVRGVVLGDTQGLLDLLRRQVQQMAGHGSAGHRAPRAARLVDGMVIVPDAGGAVRHLVADDHGRQHLCAAQPQLFGQGQRGGENLRAGMALGVEGTVVNVQTVSGVAVGEGRTDGRGPLAVQQDSGLVARPGFDGEVSCDAADRGQRAHQRGPQDVQQSHTGLALHRRRERVPGDISDEVDNLTLDTFHSLPSVLSCSIIGISRKRVRIRCNHR
jgi:hypothetical protein